MGWGTHNLALEDSEGAGWNWEYDEMLTGPRLGATLPWTAKVVGCLIRNLERLFVVTSGIFQGSKSWTGLFGSFVLIEV